MYLFLGFFISKIGFPIFPPNEHFKLFFLKRWAINLQVVDFPFVPVTTIVLDLLLVK